MADQRPARSAAYWIEGLGLIPHPEGGYYRESYRSRIEIDVASIGKGFSGRRSASTAIYYLLEGSDFSAFHRIRSDEMWHYYAGGALAIHTIDPAGNYEVLRLDSSLEGGRRPQWTVRAGLWFAASLDASSGYALVGCTVAPGFAFQDFELGSRDELTGRFPAHRNVIETFTRE